MNYYKVTSNDYILGIGTGDVGESINESEYNEIISAINSSPHREGYGYRLKTDLTWEEYEKPEPDPEPDPEPEKASSEDYEEALQQMGVDFSD